MWCSIPKFIFSASLVKTDAAICIFKLKYRNKNVGDGLINVWQFMRIGLEAFIISKAEQSSTEDKIRKDKLMMVLADVNKKL